ncbi:unnamed protein product [Brassicogethes aeneus]|uniref:THAP-type domain-containing protein n=1 Tax=Brassicogethes aeneus TaxID=1431903 RepID=A0A9P0ATW0_BRAAE|nr:unnamed protein product [Brassicogethes aeneus]
MACCIVKTCKNNYRNSGLKFHNLPANWSNAKEWIKAAGNPHVNREKFRSYRVCSVHFDLKYMVRHRHEVLYGLPPPLSYRGLTEDAVPTLFLPEKSETLDLPEEAICANKTNNSNGELPQPIEFIKVEPTDCCDTVEEIFPEENLEIKEEDLSEEIDIEFAEQCIDYAIKYLKQRRKTNVVNRIEFLENLKKDLPTLE